MIEKKRNLGYDYRQWNVKEKIILNTNGNKNTLKANKILIPVILLIGLIPIIVHSFVYDTNLAQFDWYPESAAKQTDFFFAWKMIAIILVGAVMLAIPVFE